MALVRRGGACIVGAALFFALMGGVIKHLANLGLDTWDTVWLRNACGLVALLPWLLRRGPTAIRTGHPGLHAIRDLSGLAAMGTFFYAIAHIPLAEAVLLTYTSPLFIPFIARVWLGEPIPRRTVAAVAVGMVGLLLILRPGYGVFRPAAWVGWSSGPFAAVAMVAIRRLSRAGEPDLRTVFWFAASGTLCTGFGVIAHPPVWPASIGWWLLALGITATAGQLCLTRGYRLAPAGQVGPFIYLSPVCAAGLGGLWGEWPDLLSVAGAGLVVVGNVVAAGWVPRRFSRGS